MDLILEGCSHNTQGLVTVWQSSEAMSPKVEAHVWGTSLNSHEGIGLSQVTLIREELIYFIYWFERERERNLLLH